MAVDRLKGGVRGSRRTKLKTNNKYVTTSSLLLMTTIELRNLVRNHCGHMLSHHVTGFDFMTLYDGY